MRRTSALAPILLLSACATADLGAPDVGNDHSPRLAAIRGLVNVDGENVIVEVLAEVEPGEEAEDKARDVLARAYPEATPLDELRFSLNGLVWDVFFDADPDNDHVDASYNPDGEPAGITLDSLSGAEASWTDVDGSVFAFAATTGITDRCPSLVDECKGRQFFDGNNDVGWLSLREPGVIGVTWYGTSTDEFDMVLDNKDFDWYEGDALGIGAGQIDAETIYLHELGHALGLGHTDDTTAVMYAYYSLGTVQRTPAPDDEGGIREIYGPPTPCATNLDCDDANACNGAETCDLATGDCVAGTPVDCDDGDACTDDACNPADGSCDYTAVSCDDGDDCTTDSCVDNTCVSETIPGCLPPACGASGASCTSSGDCCSNKCKGKPGAKTCV